MTKTFLIASLNGRIEGMFRLISSLSKYSDWNLIAILQQYPKEQQNLIEMHCDTIFHNRSHVLISNDASGPHLARCIAFDKYKSDVWCILDDDMFAIEGLTDYNTMADIVFSKSNIGFLSGNWRKTKGMAEKVQIKPSLLKQNIVYTGGGMLFRQDVADIIKNIPRVQYLFDNPLWSIYAYVNGYDNFRYLGSMAVHEICTVGGRRKWISENNKYKSLPPAEWLRVRRGKGKAGCFDEYLICDSSDITDTAHELHNKNHGRVNQ